MFVNYFTFYPQKFAYFYPKQIIPLVRKNDLIEAGVNSETCNNIFDVESNKTGKNFSIFDHDNISISDKNKLMYFPDVRPLPERKFYGSNNHLHDGLERAHLQRKEMGSCEVLFGRLPRGLKPWEAHYKLEEK